MEGKQSLHNEYKLTYSKINPNNKSPNIFITKLSMRLNLYFNHLYKHIISSKKQSKQLLQSG